MRVRVVLLALAVATAGCLDAGPSSDAPPEGEESGDPEPGNPAPRVVTRTFVYEGNVSAGTEGGPVGVNGTVVLGSGLQGVTLELAWTQASNAFEARGDPPAGDEVTATSDAPAGGTSASAEADDPAPGLWRFSVLAEGSHLPDRVRLFVNATWRLPGPADAAGGDAAPGPVQAERTGSGWRAWRDYHANGTVGDAVEVTADTANGAANLSAGGPEVSTESGAGPGDPSVQPETRDGDTARVRVHVWAHADTEQRARERVQSVNVTVEVAGDRVRVNPQAPEWQQRGADVDVALPADTRSRLDLETTNGPVNARAADARQARLETTNGPIHAGIRGQGSIGLETTNGPLVAALVPTADVELDAASTNGPVQLGLQETDEIGYTIDAETSNDRITEDMDEAELEGSEEEATLRTRNAGERPIQVTGTAGTTNGNVHFQGR